MVEEVKTVDTNTKTQLSLAAALFFSPLVQNMLKRNTRDITDQDRNFIRGYIKFGYITLLFGIITIAAGVLNYLFALNILNVVYVVSIFILLLLLFISVVSILSDISLVRGTDSEIHAYTIEGNKKDIIFKYLPIYNIYLWYQTHSFEKPNRWIKESILLRIVFLVVCTLGSTLVSTIVLIIIILRVASLMSDIDFFHTQTKQQLNKLFFKNPEEIRGYVSGFFLYLARSLIHTANKQPLTLSEAITKEKEAYGYIIDIQNNTHIVREYIIGIIVMIGLVYSINLDFTVRTYYAILLLVIVRYLVMAIQLKHLPHLPIAREILLLIKGIGLLFKKKSFIQNP